MAVTYGTMQTFSRNEIREDLENVVNDLTPEETPLYSMASKIKADNIKHEWLWDKSEDGTSNNAVTQGDDPAAETSVTMIRFFNYSQLMDKVVRIGSTQRASNNAGYEDSLAYQMAKRALELRKDVDAAMSKNGACTTGAPAIPTKMAGLESWLTYGGNDGQALLTGCGTSAKTTSAATTPGFQASIGCATAPTDGTAGYTVTETMVKSCILNVVQVSSSRVTQLLMAPQLKEKFATEITGIATRYREVPRGQAAIVAGADLYVSNFGDIVLSYSRQMRYSATLGGPVFGLNPKHIAVATLQPFKQEPLAKTGHADTRMLSVEATLVVKDPRSLFKIGDTIDFTAA